jgi:hypothetical protein
MKNNQARNSSSGIFLLYEGLPPTIIESQVLTHASSMIEAGVQMEVWTFAVTPGANSIARSALARLRKAYPNVVIRLFRGVKPALPFSEWLNAMLLGWWMWRLNALPTFVHARTEHAAAIAAIVKKIRRFRLVWDARGDSLSEFRETAQRLPWHSRWMAPLKIRAISKRLKMAVRHADYAIFVSEALRKLQGSTFPIERTVVVPCLADEDLFYFEQNLREESRRKLGYSETDIVIVYVGSTSIWQCVPETITLMEQAMRANAACKALVVTPSREAFEQAFPADLRDRVNISSGNLGDMNSFLNAADFGVLLRKPNAINRVASPVKFAEYSLAGLTVVTTGAVEQIEEIGERLGNTLDAKECIEVYVKNGKKPADRASMAIRARMALGRKTHNEKILNLYCVCK